MKKIFETLRFITTTSMLYILLDFLIGTLG